MARQRKKTSKEGGFDLAPTALNVLDVRWGRAADEPLGTMWILGFYDVAWFWATTIPRSRQLPGGHHEAVPMTWPR
jgi:hypothetical protein